MGKQLARIAPVTAVLEVLHEYDDLKLNELAARLEMSNRDAKEYIEALRKRGLVEVSNGRVTLTNRSVPRATTPFR